LFSTMKGCPSVSDTAVATMRWCVGHSSRRKRDDDLHRLGGYGWSRRAVRRRLAAASAVPQAPASIASERFGRSGETIVRWRIKGSLENARDPIENPMSRAIPDWESRNVTPHAAARPSQPFTACIGAHGQGGFSHLARSQPACRRPSPASRRCSASGCWTARLHGVHPPFMRVALLKRGLSSSS
jgi:hypothetical protein